MSVKSEDENWTYFQSLIDAKILQLLRKLIYKIHTITLVLNKMYDLQCWYNVLTIYEQNVVIFRK